MARISATFKPTIENMTKAYAAHYEISFSEAVEMLTGASVTTWWSKLPKVAKEEYRKKFNIGGKK